MTDGKGGVVSDPAIVRQRNLHDAELWRDFEDVVSKEALLFVRRKVGVEMIETEA